MIIQIESFTNFIGPEDYLHDSISRYLCDMHAWMCVGNSIAAQQRGTQGFERGLSDGRNETVLFTPILAPLSSKPARPLALLSSVSIHPLPLPQAGRGAGKARTCERASYWKIRKNLAKPTRARGDYASNRELPQRDKKYLLVLMQTMC